MKGLSVPTRKAAFKVAQACSKKKAISVLAKKSQTAQCKVTREKATHLVPTKIVGDVPRSRNKTYKRVYILQAKHSGVMNEKEAVRKKNKEIDVHE